MPLRLISMLMLLLLVFAPVACKKKKRKIMSVGVNYKGKQFNLVPDQSLDEPKDFPAEIPIYPKADFLYQANLVAPARIFTFETKDVPMAVSNFYRDKLKAGGWRVQPRTTNETNEVLIAGKNGYGILLSAQGVAETNTTLIQMIIDPKAAQGLDSDQ